MTLKSLSRMRRWSVHAAAVLIIIIGASSVDAQTRSATTFNVDGKSVVVSPDGSVKISGGTVGARAGSQLEPVRLDENWMLTANGQTVQVDPDGSFRIFNIAAPDFLPQAIPSGPPCCDFISDDVLQVTGINTAFGVTRYLSTEFFQIARGQTFVIEEMLITDVPPLVIDSIIVAAGETVLEPGQSTQLTVTALASDNTTLDVTPFEARTVYRSSNPRVATVAPDGLLTAQARGSAFVAATNLGVTSVVRIHVATGTAPTTIDGFVQRLGGTPFAGAEVTIVPFGVATTTGSDGHFALSLDLPTDGTVSVSVTGLVADQAFVGSSDTIVITPDGITDMGIIVIQGQTGILYGVQGGDCCGGWLFTIDPGTGMVELVADLEEQFPKTDLCGPSGITISPDRQTLYISLNFEDAIISHDIASGQSDFVGHFTDASPSDIAFLADGTTMVVSDPQRGALYNVDPNTAQDTFRCSTVIFDGLQNQPVRLSGLSLSPSGVLYASTGGSRRAGDVAPPGALLILDPTPNGSNECVATLVGSGTGFNRVAGIAFLPDGRLVGATARDLEFISIDTTSGVGTLIDTFTGLAGMCAVDGMVHTGTGLP